MRVSGKILGQMSVMVSALVLQSCAPPRPQAIEPENVVKPVEERRAEIQTIRSFEINGAIAAKNPKKSWTASINWLQSGPAHYQLRLNGPLGSGAMLIKRQGGQVSLQDGPKRVSSNNPDQLLLKETGVRLPVRNLYYWVRALPAPGGAQNITRDRFNHITSLRQDGYQVEYVKYTSTRKGDLPSSIRLKGHGISVKLIIKRWKV